MTRIEAVESATAAVAARKGYDPATIEAGLEFLKCKNRISNPPGSFDNAGRFYASETSVATSSCREPSRAWPMSQMKAARTAAHCAEIFGNVEPLHVKRIARVGDHLLKQDLADTSHREIELRVLADRMLKGPSA